MGTVGGAHKADAQSARGGLVGCRSKRARGVEHARRAYMEGAAGAQCTRDKCIGRAWWVHKACAVG